ncbi:MAG: hypothetical protein HKN27_15015 [Silicimonas sp.]|nr:hypothetical protein [Silicimonas sp.]
MPHVVDTQSLVAESWITHEQAAEIARRSRETMVSLAVNAVLCAGILAATFGLIFWLADALAVAAAGGIFLAAGAGVLTRASALYRMLGNAGALVGAGMLVGGAGSELVDNFRDIAEPIMIFGGLAISAASVWMFSRGPDVLRFCSGAVMLFGLAMHISGLGMAVSDIEGLMRAVFLGYVALLVAAAGTLLNVRFVTALAIVPFAQMLDTGTSYFHAAYVFYSPESTLTILQMAALVGACAWAATKLSERYARHTGILAVMGIVVGNLAFLVGSLWGDHVGISLASGAPVWEKGLDYDAWREVREAWEAQFFHISEHVFTIAWGILLAAGAFWTAHANKRGLFNATMTFAGIHAYTQLFETMSDEPMAWAIGGLAAIPAAWGMWRFNQYLAARAAAS